MSANELYPTGSRLGILCGLPKTHKCNIPLRPILSCINHYSYNIAKFFIPLLTPISTSTYVIKDSFSFQELLSSDPSSTTVLRPSNHFSIDDKLTIASYFSVVQSMYMQLFLTYLNRQHTNINSLH